MKYLIRNVWIGNSSDNMYGGGTWRDWADADNKNTPDINKARVYDDAQGYPVVPGQPAPAPAEGRVDLEAQMARIDAKIASLTDS